MNAEYAAFPQPSVAEEIDCAQARRSERGERMKVTSDVLSPRRLPDGAIDRSGRLSYFGVAIVGIDLGTFGEVELADLEVDPHD